LFKKDKKENIELYQELKDESNDILTNERKTYYEDQNIDSLKTYYYYFLLVIYIICVICFGVFSLIYPSQTDWKIRLFALIAFIALPFFSTWILGKIIYFIYEAYNLLPKNVYNQKNF
jgi:ABC-type transport system involved in cytochrome bd biosynthesis fused ATPase/permease subunit